MTISLIIATYNWPRALHLCLESVLRQTQLPAEILIADDGSGSETRDVVDHFKSISPVPLHHIWHEDDGFRLAAIRNKAIAQSCGEYIIQVDGDVILERHFVEDHCNYALEGYFVSGSRAMLSVELTERLLDGKQRGVSLFSKQLDCRLNALRVPIITSLFRNSKPQCVRGCNMAFWRIDLLTVNGYDESFKGWGHEDLEIAHRLRALGRSKRTIKFRGVQFHLNHPLASRENHACNGVLSQKSCLEKRTRTPRGVDQYAITPTKTDTSVHVTLRQNEGKLLQKVL